MKRPDLPLVETDEKESPPHEPMADNPLYKLVFIKIPLYLTVIAVLLLLFSFSHVFGIML